MPQWMRMVGEDVVEEAGDEPGAFRVDHHHLVWYDKV